MMFGSTASPTPTASLPSKSTIATSFSFRTEMFIGGGSYQRMNLVLLFEDDFVDGDIVRLGGRRAAHIARVHRAGAGDTLVVGIANGRIGSGTITRMTED